jgi:hypothetical protein
MEIQGHAGLRGVVSATSVDTGKLIDVETTIKYCQGCENVKDNEEKLKQHRNNDACPINYCGVSGGMEEAGPVAIYALTIKSVV